MNETELERMVVRLLGDASGYVRMCEQAATQTQTTAKQIEQSATRIEGFSSSIGSFAKSALMSVTSLVAGVGFIGTAFKAVNIAAEAEKNEIAFGTMLKSVEAGKQMVKDLTAFAAATPLGQAEIQQATKLLLQFGTQGKDILPTLKMIGNVTGGNAQNFLQMSLAFGQMSATGRLMGQDLLQMINAGFNPMQEMSRTTGKSMAQLKDEMEKGKISLDMVKAAFASATGAGGQFEGLMEKQSKSLSGLFSTMQDDISMALKKVGDDIALHLNLGKAMEFTSKQAQSFGERIGNLPPILKTIAAVITVITGSLVVSSMAVNAAAFGWSMLGRSMSSTLNKIQSISSGVGIGGAVASSGPAMPTAWQAFRKYGFDPASAIAPNRNDFRATANTGASIETQRQAFQDYDKAQRQAVRGTGEFAGVLRGVGWGLAIAGATAAAAAIYNWYGKTKMLNEELERSSKLAAAQGSMMEKKLATALTRPDKEHMSSQQRAESFAMELGISKKDVEGIERNINDVKAKLDEHKKSLGGFNWLSANVVGDATEDTFKRQIKEYEEQLTAAKNAVAQLTEAHEKAKIVGGVPKEALQKGMEAISELRAHMDFESRTWNMGPQEKAVEGMKDKLLKLGYTAEVAEKSVAQLRREAKEMDKTGEFVSKVKAMEKELEFFNEEVERTLSGKDMGSIRNRIASIREEARRNGIGLSDSENTKLRRAEALAAFEDDLKKFESVQSKVKGLTESFGTPIEKFNLTMRDLNTTFADPMSNMSITTYSNAVNAARKSLAEGQMAAAGLNHELQKLDGTIFGSAESIGRMDSYRDMLLRTRAGAVMPAGATAPLVPVAQNMPGLLPGQGGGIGSIVGNDKALPLLQVIAGNTGDMASNPSIKINGAGLK